MTPAMSRGIRRRQQKDFESTLRDLGCSPVEILVAIATNNVPCGVCQRTPGKQRVALPWDQQKPCQCNGMGVDPDCWKCSGTGHQTATERVCQSCYGTLFEAVNPDVRSKVAMKMLDKLVPDLRSVDHVSSDGSQRPAWELVIVDQRAKLAGRSAMVDTTARIQAPED